MKIIYQQFYDDLPTKWLKKCRWIFGKFSNNSMLTICHKFANNMKTIWQQFDINFATILQQNKNLTTIWHQFADNGTLPPICNKYKNNLKVIWKQKFAKNFIGNC